MNIPEPDIITPLTEDAALPQTLSIDFFIAPNAGEQVNAGGSRSFTSAPEAALARAPLVVKLRRRESELSLLKLFKSKFLKTNAVDKPSLL